jgi:lipocalin
MTIKISFTDSLIIAFAVCCCIALTSGDVLRLGRCPPVKLQRNFKPFLFTGDWYEIARNPIFILGTTKCNKLNLKANNENGLTIRFSSMFK